MRRTEKASFSSGDTQNDWAIFLSMFFFYLVFLRSLSELSLLFPPRYQALCWAMTTGCAVIFPGLVQKVDRNTELQKQVGTLQRQRLKIV